MEQGGLTFTSEVRAELQHAKRDTLYAIYDPLLSDTVSFTLATNPYRTALVEHGRNVGVLTLVPVSADEKKRLDGLRDEAIKTPGLSIAATFAPTSSPEYQEEESRLKQFANGSLSIGDEDLVRLLRLSPIEPPPPPPKVVKPPKHPKPAPVPPPPPPVTVELYNGVNKSGTATFPVPYNPPPPIEVPDPPEAPEPVYVPPPPAKYLFRSPLPKAAPAPVK